MNRLFLLIFCFFSVSCVANHEPARESSWTPREIDLPDDEELDEEDLPEAGEDDTGEG